MRDLYIIQLDEIDKLRTEKAVIEEENNKHHT